MSTQDIAFEIANNQANLLDIFYAPIAKSGPFFLVHQFLLDNYLMIEDKDANCSRSFNWQN